MSNVSRALINLLLIYTYEIDSRCSAPFGTCHLNFQRTRNQGPITRQCLCDYSLVCTYIITVTVGMCLLSLWYYKNLAVICLLLSVTYLRLSNGEWKWQLECGTVI